MDTIKIQKSKTKIIAHRGLSGIECENSLPAFVAAANRSYFGIETDVHLTADKRFVLMHDNETLRVTGVEKKLSTSNYDELQTLLLNDPRKHDTVARRDLVIPTLEEYLSVCNKYGKMAVIEIKCDMTYCADRLIETIESCHSLDKTTVISFGWDNCVAVKKLRPELKVQYLSCRWKDELLEKLVEHKIDLDVEQTAVTKELIDLLHQNGLELNAWTVDSPETAEKFCGWGIDYLTTNILEQNQ